MGFLIDSEEDDSEILEIESESEEVEEGQNYEETDEFRAFFPPINVTDLVDAVSESLEKLLREQEERLAQRRLNIGYRKRIPRQGWRCCKLQGYVSHVLC